MSKPVTFKITPPRRSVNISLSCKTKVDAESGILCKAYGSCGHTCTNIKLQAQDKEPNMNVVVLLRFLVVVLNYSFPRRGKILDSWGRYKARVRREIQGLKNWVVDAEDKSNFIHTFCTKVFLL